VSVMCKTGRCKTGTRRSKTVQTMTGAFSRVDVHTTLHATRSLSRR